MCANSSHLSYILANTEQLHEKIIQMSDRIRDLEDALGALHLQHEQCSGSHCFSSTNHPLLQGDLLLVKSHHELYGIEPSRHSRISSPAYQEAVQKPHDSELDPNHTQNCAPTNTTTSTGHHDSDPMRDNEKITNRQCGNPAPDSLFHGQTARVEVSEPQSDRM